MQPFFSGVILNHSASNPALSAGITIREAEEHDVSEMVETVNAAFEEEAFFVNRPRTSAGQLVEQFRNGHFLLAHQGTQLVASVYCQVRGESGFIGMLAVRPGQQRRGLGRAIMLAAEDVLRRAGCRAAELTVVDVRIGIPGIYRKLGYHETGTEEPYEELRQKLTMPVKLIRMEKAL
jgi:ribosomal protein S18 acetylase RimI-like enzyme